MRWKLGAVAWMIVLACLIPAISQTTFLAALGIVLAAWVVFVLALMRGEWHWDQFLKLAAEAGAPDHLIRLGRSL